MEATGNWALLRRVPMGFRRTGGGKEYWRYRALRCEGKRKEEKRMKKMVKGLEKDLSALCSSVAVVAAKPEGGGGGMAGEIKAQVMSEAAELLLSQLKQLRADAKEMKKKRKQEKAAMKAANKKVCKDDSSSSSSESSDSECETVFKMSSLRTLINNPRETEPKNVSSPLASSVLLQTTEDAIEEAEDNNITEEEKEIAAEMVVKPVDKIEVCMGGKCKKSGATVLLAEFERKVGIEGAVVGCKCMGKCRSGPNVRVVNHHSSRADDDGSHSGVLTNPLCIGVGLEDVTSIVANFWGEKKDVGLLAA